MTKTPIKRTLVLSFSLEELALALGKKEWLSTNEYLDADSHDDVYHSGYSKSDVRCYDFPEPFSEAPKIFWAACSRAIEDRDRDELASALGAARRKALSESLLKVCVTGEYLYENTMFVSLSQKGECPRIDDVYVDTPNATAKLTIVNPEHLINDLLSGAGVFAPELDPCERADDTLVRQLFLSTVGDYFEIYGEAQADVPSRIDSGVSSVGDDCLRDHLWFHLRDAMDVSCAAEYVKEAVDLNCIVDDIAGIQLAAEITLLPAEEIEAELLAMRKSDLKTVQNKIALLTD